MTSPDSDDPFGRRGEEGTDAFGRPREGSLFDDPEAGASEPSAAEPPSAPATAPGGWLPPSDAPPEPAAWRPPPEPLTSVPPWVASRAHAGEPADYGQRAGAAALDFAVRLGIALVPGLLGLVVAGTDGLIGGLLLGALVSLAYAPVLLVRWDGQTVGHRAVGTRIVRRDGGRLSGGNAVVREILVKSLLIEGGGQFTLFVVTLLNYLWPLWDAHNEALHDKICGTRVVRA